VPFSRVCCFSPVPGYSPVTSRELLSLPPSPGALCFYLLLTPFSFPPFHKPFWSKSFFPTSLDFSFASLPPDFRGLPPGLFFHQWYHLSAVTVCPDFDFFFVIRHFFFFLLRRLLFSLPIGSFSLADIPPPPAMARLVFPFFLRFFLFIFGLGLWFLKSMTPPFCGVASDEISFFCSCKAFPFLVTLGSGFPSTHRCIFFQLFPLPWTFTGVPPLLFLSF